MTDPTVQLQHLLVLRRSSDQVFSRSGRNEAKISPVADRAAHGNARTKELTSAFGDIDQHRQGLDDELTIEELYALGSVVTLEGPLADYPLKIESLQRSSRRRDSLPQWLLLSVSAADLDRGIPERAVVWINDKHRADFLQLFTDYMDPGRDSEKGNPANRGLVANIARIRATVVRDLWQSSGEPAERGRYWWEVWLRPETNAVDVLTTYTSQRNMRMSTRVLELSDRVVTWIEATWSQLQDLPFTAVPVAEVRRPEFIDTIENLPVDQQDDYVIDLIDRVIAADRTAPAVCHLDSGVARTHLLIKDSLHEDDLHTVIGSDGFDLEGHGTSMAGIALFGTSLDDVLTGTAPVVLRHGLESVRILPRKYEPQTNPIAYGDITVQAISSPEAQAQRPRVFCLPVTNVSDVPDTPGQPTLWSSTLDALIAGVQIARNGDRWQVLTTPDPDASRLVVVSAGNVDKYVTDHLSHSEGAPIQDPGQAWNALTVGAYTDIVDSPIDPQYTGWSPLAKRGELSPHSRTSKAFGTKPWPIKPDIVLEGGNVLTDGTMFDTRHPLLSLRTTGATNDTALNSANATSAATAQASRLAAQAMAVYPDYWPETIRGLLVHAAEWTPQMRAHIDAAAPDGLEAKQHILRRYGWGVPIEDNVLHSANNAVTMVVQDEFKPFIGNDYAMPHFRLHRLPWPAATLQELDAADVTLRVTLSYFIEPTASRRGWRHRYSYASHGLRFELQDPLENEPHFLKRVNREARKAELGDFGPSTSQIDWLLGSRNRAYGSLHQDIWETSGQNLAQSGLLAIYPIGGWWKRNNNKQRIDLPIRYSLIVSLKTPETDIDLYTEITNQLLVPIETTIET